MYIWIILGRVRIKFKEKTHKLEMIKLRLLMIFCIQWKTVDGIQTVFLIYEYSMWQSGYFLWYSIWCSDCLLDILDTVDGILQDPFFLPNTYCRGCSSCFLDILSDWYSKHDREHYRRRLNILNRINSFQKEDNSNVKRQLPYP